MDRIGDHDGVLLSSRAVHDEISRSVTYEFEDVVAELLNLRIVSPRVPRGPGLRRRAWWAARQPRLARRRQRGCGPRVLIAMGQSIYDLADQMANLDSIERADHRVAYVEEMWRTELPLRRDLRLLLDRFDHVFLGLAGTCQELDEVIAPPVSYLPPALNLQRFVGGYEPARVIDVYAMGRRNPAHHEVLLEWAAERGAFYHFDTIVGPRVQDLAEHRAHLIDLIRRTSYFMVNEAKVDQPEQRGTQSEIAYRYFEGAAAGAILLGPIPDTPMFSELFPWEDAVIPVAHDGTDLVPTLDELSGDRERVRRARRAGIRGAIDAHDVAHRVRSIMQTLDLPEPPGVSERINRLRNLAAGREASL